MRALPHRDTAAALEAVRAARSTLAVKLAFEFLALTAARSGEARLATRDEIDTAGRRSTRSRGLGRGAASAQPESGRAMTARRRVVVEPSEHPPVLVGWLEYHVELQPRANVTTRLYRGWCERCGQVVADVPRAEDAESELRAHQRTCRPMIRDRRQPAPQASEKRPG
ncbi:MAG: hypothetical protein OXG04_24120 [Acidobacteria bacterium]|nr:hypothetical protein [Acidobacteriota bacterium]